jgi:microcystin-dependent protein
MADPYIGEIRMFGGNFAPAGWALCDGGLMPIVENEALFALIGTTYGGDGQSTFARPDLRGRLPVHQGQGPGLSPRVIGQIGGTETVALGPSQIPSHAHSLLGTSNPASTRSPAGALFARPEDPLYSQPGPVGGDIVAFAPQALEPTGGGQPHVNVQPFLCVNFIIAVFGIFPPRT